jgi:hypothetical protein
MLFGWSIKKVVLDSQYPICRYYIQQLKIDFLNIWAATKGRWAQGVRQIASGSNMQKGAGNLISGESCNG